MPHRLIALTLLAGFACAGQAGAMSLDQYRASLVTVQDRYRTSVEKCRPMQGNARDICKVEARSAYDVAKAELKAQYQPTPKHADRIRTGKAEAAYRLATER